MGRLTLQYVQRTEESKRETLLSSERPSDTLHSDNHHNSSGYAMVNPKSKYRRALAREKKLENEHTSVWS
jgi:hypothetical protein